MKSTELKFGFKSRRPVKEKETMKHDFPYVEVIPATKKGSVTKFRLLNGAAELLKFGIENNKVSYLQSDIYIDEFYLANTSDIITAVESKINADNSFNNKALHKRICEDWELELTETLTFEVIEAELEGYEEVSLVQFIPINNSKDSTTSKTVVTEPTFVPINPEDKLSEEEDPIVNM